MKIVTSSNNLECETQAGLNDWNGLANIHSLFRTFPLPCLHIRFECLTGVSRVLTGASTDAISTGARHGHGWILRRHIDTNWGWRIISINSIGNLMFVRSRLAIFYGHLSPSHSMQQKSGCSCGLNYFPIDGELPGLFRLLDWVKAANRMSGLGCARTLGVRNWLKSPDRQLADVQHK